MLFFSVSDHYFKEGVLDSYIGEEASWLPCL